MPDGSFAHLHVHTEYSMLDGAARIDDLFAEAARQGMPAVATTDHGYIFGAYEFWKAGQKHGVKPIIGLEAYLTPGTHRSDRTRIKWGGGGRDDVSGSGAYTHMTMLARTTGGMHNLFRLASRASLEGHYFKPRMDRELLQTYGEGLIATTGCPSGEVQTRLRLGQYAEARAAAAEFRDLFGAENYYCELMDHGLGIEREVQRDLLRLARDLGLPLVATNDLHYTRAEDATAHAALLCVQSGSTLADPNRFKFDADDFYLKSAAEMRHLWRELPEACDNTLLIAERCEVTFTEGEGRFMPRFPCPPGESEHSWFFQEVEAGLRRRYPDGIPDRGRQQAEYETEVIVDKGYPGYFLVVADFINWAKANGIRVGPGRGSGAGSMAASAMGITDPDVRKVVETARGLEGLKRQWGVHAAGVIMSSEPLVDLIPIMRREQDGQIITQFDYPSCETLGLVKMDFLGLRNLTILDDALKNVEASRGISIDLDELSKTLDDGPTYELLSRGDTLGVFQLDGGPMRSLLRLMRPDNFEDVSAVIALYRPGPMGANSHTNYALRKNRQQEIVPIHEELREPLAEILDTTYGLIVYQEQVMAIARKVAGYSLAQADLLRRAMGKKK